MTEYTFYVAGAAEPNPGKIGIGIVGLRGEREREHAQGGYVGTNIAAALYAIRAALSLNVANPAAPITVKSNALVVIRALRGEGTLDAQAALLREVQEFARDRGAVAFEHVANKTGDRHLQRAQELARRAL